MRSRRPVSIGSLGLLSLCVGTGAYAQSTQDALVDEVIVTGFRGSLELALEAKRESVNFTDSISSEDVGKLPDNNLAEALQRVPGVQISRTNGEGQQISLRGMGPSFARVLLDGMPISVASEGSVDQQARNREFDFDLLPSEIFSKLEVSKTPRASLVEGGLSGTVNLQTPRPFDYQNFTASYQLQAAYQDTSEEIDPRASFLLSKNWNDTFGALVSVSVSERTFRTDGWSSQGWTSGRIPGNPPAAGYSGGFDWNLPSVFADPANTAPGFVNESGLTNAELANAQIPRLGRPEVQIGTRDRVGGTVALQWAPSDDLNFSLDVLYSELETDFDRYTNNLLVRNTGLDSTGNPNAFGYITPSNFVLDANKTLQSGTLQNARFWSENRLFQQESDFLHVGLGSNWQITENIGIELKASRAESDFRWRMTTYLFTSDPGDVNITVGSGIPRIEPQVDLSNSANWIFDTIRIQPRTREEENENLALNATFGDENRNIRVGALFNTYFRERLSYSSSIGFDRGAALQPYGFTGGADLRTFDLTNFTRTVPVNFGENFDDNPGYRRWLVADLGAFSNMMNPSALDAAANLDYQNSGSFEEDNFSAYVEANAAFDLGGHTLRANVGVRYVETSQEMIGFLQTPNTPPAADNLLGLRADDYARNTIEGEYDEILPSLNLAYDISENLIARFAASRAMTRPNPADIQPFTSISTDGVVTQGNPNLDPYLSDQLDGGLEWYFTEGAVVGGNLFYKEISGFVQRQRIEQPFRNAGIPLDTIIDPTFRALVEVNGLDTMLLFNTPINLPDKTYLKGVELLYQQRLDMLLQGLGVTVNFTRLDSGDAVIAGLADYNYNAVAYYETDRFAVRLSYNFRDDYVECERNCGSTSPEAGFRRDAGYLDLSSSVNFSAFEQDFTLSFEALNLTDEEEYSYYGYGNRTNTLNRPGRQYIIGIRGQF